MNQIQPIYVNSSTITLIHTITFLKINLIGG